MAEAELLDVGDDVTVPVTVLLLETVGEEVGVLLLVLVVEAEGETVWEGLCSGEAVGLLETVLLIDGVTLGVRLALGEMLVEPVAVREGVALLVTAGVPVGVFEAAGEVDGDLLPEGLKLGVTLGLLLMERVGDTLTVPLLLALGLMLLLRV